MPEKYRLKAFAMDERHLRATLALLAPKRRFDEKSGSSNRTDMLEEVVDWLTSEGRSLRHEFLFFEDDYGEVWLLSRNNAQRQCLCCVPDRPKPGERGKGADEAARKKTAEATQQQVEKLRELLKPLRRSPTVQMPSSNKIKPVKVPLVGGSKPPAKPPRPSISVIDVDGRTTEKVEPSEFSKASVKNGGGGVITRQPASSLHPSSNMTAMGSNKPAAAEEPTCCSYFWAECGRCCASLITNWK